MSEFAEMRNWGGELKVVKLKLQKKNIIESSHFPKLNSQYKGDCAWYIYFTKIIIGPVKIFYCVNEVFHNEILFPMNL